MQDASLNGSMLGLYDFHARFYNPIYGRWFNFDPAHQTINPYLYCGNSPMMYQDPNGQFFFTMLSSMIPGLQFLAPLASELDFGWMSGGIMSGASGKSFLEGAGMGLGMAGINIAASGLTSGIGDFFGHETGGWGTELLRTGSHGLVSGGMSLLQGGKFGDGFAMGSISSIAGSGMSELGMSGSNLRVSMGLTGSMTSMLLGGDPVSGFWKGFGIGMFNHTEIIDGVTYETDDNGNTTGTYNEAASVTGYRSSAWKYYIGPSLILSGQRIHALKPVGALGSKPGSSIASAISRNIPGKLPFRAFGTRGLGAAVGRFVPYVGWALTISDYIFDTPHITNPQSNGIDPLIVPADNTRLESYPYLEK